MRWDHIKSYAILTVSQDSSCNLHTVNMKKIADNLNAAVFTTKFVMADIRLTPAFEYSRYIFTNLLGYHTPHTVERYRAY